MGDIYRLIFSIAIDVGRIVSPTNIFVLDRQRFHQTFATNLPVELFVLESDLQVLDRGFAVNKAVTSLVERDCWLIFYRFMFITSSNELRWLFFRVTSYLCSFYAAAGVL